MLVGSKIQKNKCDKPIFLSAKLCKHCLVHYITLNFQAPCTPIGGGRTGAGGSARLLSTGAHFIASAPDAKNPTYATESRDQTGVDSKILMLVSI